MKKFITLIFFITILTVSSKAQILTPVQWSYGAKKLNKSDAIIFIKATIDNGWHVYSQYVKDGGPVKTTITFAPSKEFTTVGRTEEPKPISEFEKAFGMSVSYFERSVIFQQKIKLKTGTATIKGTLEYMTCDNKQCLPPEDIDFNIPVK